MDHFKNVFSLEGRTALIVGGGGLGLPIAQALMERETLTAKELEELLTTGSITDPDDKDEDDKPQSGTPAVTPLPVEQAEKPEAVAKETEKESEEEHEKEAEPKFNVTHYDK